jgi:DNA-binding IclR family transcriptional regulator
MLSQILKEFERSTEPMDLNELSRRLGTERSALEGMLELLVRQGKLREIQPGSIECSHCSRRAGCGYLHSGKLLGTVYELATGSQ